MEHFNAYLCLFLQWKWKNILMLLFPVKSPFSKAILIYPTKLSWAGGGKALEQQLRGAGAVVRWYPTANVRSRSYALLEQLWRDSPGPRSENPQQDGRHWSYSCVEMERLWGATPQPRQRRSPSKMVGVVNSHLESNPIPARDAQKAQTNPVLTRTQGPHRDWDRNVLEHLLWRNGSAVDCRRDRGSGYSRLGHGISPLGGGRH